MTYDVMPAHLVVRAMRDSGYKNAAYAIAELVDNSIQANATLVEIACEENRDYVRQRAMLRVRRIAVIDNGTGMDATVLRMALQYGNGTRLNDRSGIGRFGMGLPNSSLSQARRVDVYTWTNGYRNAIHSYLDVSEISAGQMTEVPEPQPQPIPEQWLKASETIRTSRTGTVVVWDQIDRCDWKTARAIFRNSEYTIGRVYRHQLASGNVRIKMLSFIDGEDNAIPADGEDVRPNDPLYLMSTTSCPRPWSDRAMFDEFGDPNVITWTAPDGVSHQIRIRFSLAKPEARAQDQTGRMPHGQHAKRNIGVSVVRAARELELQGEWCIGYDPRERWWGIEVQFPPALDEIFGVTNNKQSATALSLVAKVETDQIADREGYASEQELLENWQNDDDPRLVLIKVKNAIESNLRTIRATLKAQAEGRRTRQARHPEQTAEAKGTKATNRRRDEGHVGVSDRGELLPPSQRRSEIAQTLKKAGVEPDDAETRATQVVDDGRKYEFFKTDLASPEFFTVRRKGGSLLIGLNTNHPAYDRLITVLEYGDEEPDPEGLRARLRRSYEGLKLLLEAWARYEDELTDGRRRDRAQEARLDWGRVARSFFREDDI